MAIALLRGEQLTVRQVLALLLEQEQQGRIKKLVVISADAENEFHVGFSSMEMGDVVYAERVLHNVISREMIVKE